MNVVLLEEPDRRAGSTFLVAGARARHLLDVLGVEAGSSVRVGLVDGPLGTAAVVSAGAGDVLLDCRFEAAVPPRGPTDLVLAIPRPKMLRRLFPEIAALGVDRVTLLRTWRVAKPYLTAHVLRPEVFRPLLLDGLMQARGTRLPRVVVEPLFKPFVEDRAADALRGRTGLVLDPRAQRAVAGVGLAAGERVTLAIGPEGGFLPYEVDALRAAGYAPVSMGRRTLRVDTAVVAALAQVDLLRRQSGMPTDVM